MFNRIAQFVHRLRHAGDTPARRLYAQAVAQARLPVFYRSLAVPDTVDGRFELVVLHVFLLLRRLKGEGEAADHLGRMVLETMVEDFDLSIREFGIGDAGVKKRVRTMLRGFAGRLSAYHRAFEDSGLDAGALALDVALDNNLYGTVPDVAAETRAALAAYLHRALAGLDTLPLAALLDGQVTFVAPETTIPAVTVPIITQED